MKILVTGGAGYLGSVLVPNLLDLGCEVTVLDTFARGTPIFAACCSNPAFNPIRGDVRDSRLVRPLVERADVIIPMAALVGAPLCSRDEHGAISVNRDAVCSILDYRSREQAVIFPATDSGYGSGEVDENSTMNPVSLYARTKYEAEKHVLGCGGTTLRLASVFGMAPQMRTDLMVNDFVWRAVTDRVIPVFEGEYYRNFVHVQDVADAFVHAIENAAHMRGEAYNVGNPACSLAKAALAGFVSGIVGGVSVVHIEKQYDPDRRNCRVSNDKLLATGWAPTRSLGDGIRELMRGYQMLRNTRYGNA